MRIRFWLFIVAVGFLKYTVLEVFLFRFFYVRFCFVFWELFFKANCLYLNRVSGLVLGNLDEVEGYRENFSV